MKPILVSALVASMTLFPSAASGQTQAPNATEGVTPDTPITLQPITVTGSRVSRVDHETPSPVVTYSAATIEESGHNTVGEFLQTLPFNNGPINSDLNVGSFITGAATINPRGLGSNRVLTLVNGRRPAPYGLTDSFSGTPQTLFNFNSVPPFAIERIEFLKDGASAIYGSDAVTGVMNIILKKNYSGTTIDFNASNTLKHDSLDRRVSVFTGVSAKGWDFTFGVTSRSRHANFARDFVTTSADYRYLGAKGRNLLSTINIPTNPFLTAAQAVAASVGTASGYYVITGGAPTANPTKAAFSYAGPTTTQILSANRADPVQEFQLYPASDSHGAYGTLAHRLTPNVSLFAQFTANRGKTYSQYPSLSVAPVGLTLPATNPYNPLGISLTNTASSSAFSFKSPMPFTFQAGNTGVAGVVGLRGSAWKIWQWESGVSYGTDHAFQAADGILVTDLQGVLSGTTRATAWNPFGPSDNPNLISAITHHVRGLDSKVEAVGYDLSGSAKIWQIPLPSAGELGVATGYEFHWNTLSSHPNTISYLGAGSSLPFSGRRQTHSAYLEFSVPLQSWFELQLAGRHENYSDFGQATKPKYGAKLRLPANKIINVLLRGSYAESFKAPDLGQLYQSPTQAAGTVVDSLRPQDGSRSVSALLGGNPNLQPEEAKVRYGGFVLEAPAIKGLSLTADYFDIQVTHVIGNLPVSYLTTAEGIRQFPDAIVRNNSTQNPGPILLVNAVTRNFGFQLYRGWDFGLRYALRSERFGRFSFSSEASQIIKRGRDTGTGAGFSNQTGRRDAPVWRSNHAVSWQRKTWGAAVNANVIGKYYNSSFATPGWGENVYPVVNASLTYRGFKKLTLTLGSNNVLDHRPPPNGFFVQGVDTFYGVGVLGRTLSLRVRKEI